MRDQFKAANPHGCRALTINASPTWRRPAARLAARTGALRRHHRPGSRQLLRVSLTICDVVHKGSRLAGPCWFCSLQVPLLLGARVVAPDSEVVLAGEGMPRPGQPDSRGDMVRVCVCVCVCVCACV